MMTVRDLIALLEDVASEHGDDTEVRLAHQPQWPFEYDIADVVVADPESDGDEDDDDSDFDPGEGLDAEAAARARDEHDAAHRPVVYIAEGSQLGYLSGMAARACGWSRR